MVVSFYNLIERDLHVGNHISVKFSTCVTKRFGILVRKVSWHLIFQLFYPHLLGVVTASPSFAVIEGINLNTTCFQACERDRELVSPERAAATHATGSSWVAGLVWSPAVALSSSPALFHVLFLLHEKDFFQNGF